MNRVGEEPSTKTFQDLSAWIKNISRSRASLLTQNKLTPSHCSTCNPCMLPSVSRNPAIQPHYLGHACRASSPLCCTFMVMTTSFISQVYAVLSIVIPEALCISVMIAFFYFPLFLIYVCFSFLPLCHFFLTNCCFSSSCLSLGERTLQVACQTGERWAGWERGYCWGGT